jgi:putative transposase
VLYRTDEDALTRDIIALASEYGRFGYRRITALLWDRGWQIRLPAIRHLPPYPTRL